MSAWVQCPDSSPRRAGLGQTGTGKDRELTIQTVLRGREPAAAFAPFRAKAAVFCNSATAVFDRLDHMISERPPPRSRAKVHAPPPGGTRFVHTTDAAPGIRRQRSGKGFVYRHAGGRRVTDAATLARIDTLAIPPAYENVWICRDLHGHLQATGRDARGRKQYRYHPAWRSLRDKDKFARLIEFGERLPALRRSMRRDLATPGLTRSKVLALAIKVLDTTLMRVGNREYLRSNGSYGLTTLRNRHVDFLGHGRVRLHYRGKSGRMQERTVDDARLARLLRRCGHLPGQALFQYLDDDGQHQPIDSGMVNDYLHEAMGEAFTAKDFRTWGATALTSAILASSPLPMRGGERVRLRKIAKAVEQVAAALGNTPTVCRNSYIDPAVFEVWQAGHLTPATPMAAQRSHRTESRLLTMLKRHARRTDSRANPTRRSQ
jgi:DNA topoisomerase-1